MRPPLLLAAASLLLAPLAARAGSTPAEDPPPSRALSRELCATARLAGTTGSLRAARLVAGHLQRAGWEVELDRREVLLSLPRRIEILALDGGGEGALLFERLDRFDPDARPPGDVPPFNAWAASGEVLGEVLYVGAGLRDDYAKLRAAGIDPTGRIALARYGGAYRGVKAALAEEAGCGALLLFDDPTGDGAARGPVWPAGPWKPGSAVQRGSILPIWRIPGDPSTPGWPSAAPGEAGERLSPEEYDEHLPTIPVVPIGADHARLLLDAQERPVVHLTLDVRRELRTIQNVIARLEGRGEGVVLAGNHRDAWVRGAQDAGSGTVALLRAAQLLGERARRGWRPAHTIVLGFWDGEEQGIIGSTEWAEANADWLGAHALAYVNADAVVGGRTFHASGTPGLEPTLLAALDRIPAVRKLDGTAATGSLGAAWRASFGEEEPALRMPGSGSDYTVFLHHLGIPVLDLGFHGIGHGQNHTVFDDFPLIDRFLDPTWETHETAAHLLAALLLELSERERAGFDDARAARALARMVRSAGEEGAGEETDDAGAWLGSDRALRLELAFERLASLVELIETLPAERRTAPPPPFYASLLHEQGLVDRPWYRNPWWCPDPDRGYGAQTLPDLRLAARRSPEILGAALEELVGDVEALLARWQDLPRTVVEEDLPTRDEK